MKKKRITDFLKMKEDGEKITMITAYDATISRILDDAGVDSILVGDSLANVVQGKDDTLSVSLEEMIYHSKMVSRGVSSAHISTDMPFMSYQVSIEQALENAGRLVKEGNAESVKLEINEEYIETIYAIYKAGIPVVAHIGLCPQSVHVMGGYKIQGIEEDEHERLVDLAKLCEDAGASILLFEGVPSKLAKEITGLLNIPTIGIGAGKFCDGQVLVINDLVGLSPDPLPKFVKKYADIKKIISDSVKKYNKDVKDKKFPSKANIYE